MLFKLLALAALPASILAAPPLDLSAGFGRSACGTQTTTEILEAAKEMRVQELTGNFTLAKRANMQLILYVHVVAASTSLADGYVSDDAIRRQVQIMNERYAPVSISYTLAGIDRTVNAAWANDQDDLAMKRRLRRGRYKDVNIYIQKSLKNALAYCYYPTNVDVGNDRFLLDGCNLNYITIPGSGNPAFSTGIAAVHETGHWHGLMHTFQGNSCTGSGDEVDDTPAQASSTYECPSTRDSCPNQPGVDPIHNYMDYSNDACKTEFSNGQMWRMFNMFNQFRAAK